MPATTGIISKVFHKEIEEDDYGNIYRSAIKLEGDDNWYGLGGGKKPSANIKVSKDYYELREGDEVTIIYTTNGKYRNAKRSKITLESAPQEGKPSSSSGNRSSGGGSSSGGSGQRQGGGGNSGLAGIKVGHALNNAVQLAIAEGNWTSEGIREHAETILRLSVKLEADYESIISGDGPEPVADNAKTTAPKKRKPAKKAEPEPEPEEEVDEDPDADDIPF